MHPGGALCQWPGICEGPMTCTHVNSHSTALLNLPGQDQIAGCLRSLRMCFLSHSHALLFDSTQGCYHLSLMTQEPFLWEKWQCITAPCRISFAYICKSALTRWYALKSKRPLAWETHLNRALLCPTLTYLTDMCPHRVG